MSDSAPKFKITQPNCDDTIRRNTDMEIGAIEKISDADADFALQYFPDEAIEYSPEEEKIVLRKIDWVLMTTLCWIYALQFADKTSLSYAALMGIRQDTHLDPVTQQYSWASSIFYAGYIAWESVHHLHAFRACLGIKS